jgi:cytochrome P450
VRLFIPAETEIYISPYRIQRNPDLWEMADKFDPDRLNPEKSPQHRELALCPFGEARGTSAIVCPYRGCDSMKRSRQKSPLV